MYVSPSPTVGPKRYLENFIFFTSILSKRCPWIVVMLQYPVTPRKVKCLLIFCCVGKRGTGKFSVLLIPWKLLDSSKRQTHYIIFMVTRFLCCINCCNVIDRCMYLTSTVKVIFVRTGLWCWVLETMSTW